MVWLSMDVATRGWGIATIDLGSVYKDALAEAANQKVTLKALCTMSRPVLRMPLILL